MHPANSFGCTPCHGGRDRATSFWSAGHSPENGAAGAPPGQRSTTGSSTGSTRTPILPLKYAESGCYRCHAKRDELPRGAQARRRACGSSRTWAAGAATASTGLEKQRCPKVGPSLEKVASKVPRDWTTRWVMDPASFRANTKMPTFFYQENFVDVSGPQAADRRPEEDERAGQDRERHDGQLHRGVPLRTSRPGEATPVPGRGDAARGVEALAEPRLLRLPRGRPEAQRDLTGTYRQFGPNLSGVGLQGVAGLDLSLDLRPEGVESRTPRCRTSA